MRVWPFPIEYNWRGQRLELAKVGQPVVLKPFGPGSNRRCKATVAMVDEDRQLVGLSDRRQSVIITFDNWQSMQVQVDN